MLSFSLNVSTISKTYLKSNTEVVDCKFYQSGQVYAFVVFEGVHPFSNDKFIDYSKLKELADKNFKFDEWWKVF